MANDKAESHLASSRQHWEAHVRAQQQSGLSRAEYCRRNGLSYHALTYWRKKISRSSNSKSQLVPVPIEKILHSKQAAVSSGIKILLGNRVSIEVNEQFSAAVLGRVLAVLENR